MASAAEREWSCACARGSDCGPHLGLDKCTRTPAPSDLRSGGSVCGACRQQKHLAKRRAENAAAILMAASAEARASSPSPPPQEAAAATAEYEVAYIESKREIKTGGGSESESEGVAVEYLVRCVDPKTRRPYSTSRWIPETDLDCPEKIAEYEAEIAREDTEETRYQAILRAGRAPALSRRSRAPPEFLAPSASDYEMADKRRGSTKAKKTAPKRGGVAKPKKVSKPKPKNAAPAPVPAHGIERRIVFMDRSERACIAVIDDHNVTVFLSGGRTIIPRSIAENVAGFILS